MKTEPSIHDLLYIDSDITDSMFSPWSILLQPLQQSSEANSLAQPKLGIYGQFTYTYCCNFSGVNFRWLRKKTDKLFNFSNVSHASTSIVWRDSGCLPLCRSLSSTFIWMIYSYPKSRQDHWFCATLQILPANNLMPRDKPPEKSESDSRITLLHG